MKLQLCLLATAFCFVTVSPLQGQGWDRFRGPNGSGIGEAPDVPLPFTESDYLFNVELPGWGHSSPVIMGEKLFLTCQATERDDNMRWVVCLDKNDGSLLWSYEEEFEPANGGHRLNSAAASTPAVDENGVYVSWISGGTFILLGLDLEGELLWRHELPDFASMFGPGASPIVYDGKVVMGNEHAGGTCFIIAVDAKTGETAWRLDRDTSLASYVTPTVYSPEGGPEQLIFASTGYGVYSVNPDNGEVYWEVQCDFEFKPCACPTIVGDVIFVSTGKGGGGVESVAIRAPDVTKYEMPKLLYELEPPFPYVTTPLVLDDKIFFWQDSGFLRCITAETGETVWEERIGGTFYASPVMIGDKILNINVRGEAIIFDTSDGFEELARIQLEEATEATPAIDEGRLYIRTFNRLICVGKE